MSDIHILEGDPQAEKFTVVYHLPVPAEANAVGINLQACVAEDDAVTIYPNTYRGANTELPSGMISQQEITAMTDGELIEFSEAFTRTPGETPAQDLARIKDKWNAIAARAATLLRNRYKYWGRIETHS